MTACRRLAKQQCVDEATCLEIDQLHEDIDAFICGAIDNKADEAWVLEVLTDYDYDLQSLWNFKRDAAYHTLFKKYLFKKQWYNRTFQCNTTGEIFTIPFEVQEIDFCSFGNAYVDVGRLNAYSRFSNCKEITNDVETKTTD